MGNRVVINTLSSYGRTVVSAGLTLFTSRWILEDLGPADYGIYGLVGGLLLFVSFISSILTQSSNRFLAFAIGKNNFGEIQKWFNTSLILFLVLPLFLVPSAMILGEFLIRHVLNIAPERLNAALWVFRFSVVTFFFVLIATPYLSMLTAKQYICVSALIMLGYSVAHFVIAYFIHYFPGDHLIVYALLMTGCMAVVNVLYILVCRYLCPEARINREFWRDYGRLAQILRYTGWLSVGTIGTVFNIQGQNFVLNLARGTSANAGYGVASSLAGQMQILSNAFLQALSPEVIRREGAGDHDCMLLLAMRSVRLGMWLLLLVALPLFVECPYVLQLWLKATPPHAVFFTRLVIISSCFYKMAVGHRMCFQAVGNIRSQQIIEGLVYSATVPIIGIVFWMSESVEIAFSFAPIMQCVYFLLTAYWGALSFGWNFRDALGNILMKCAFCFVLGLVIYGFVCNSMPIPGFVRLCTVVLVLSICTSVYFYFIVFKNEDRIAVVGLVRRFLKI